MLAIITNMVRLPDVGLSRFAASGLSDHFSVFIYLAKKGRRS